MPRCPFSKTPPPYLQRILQQRAGFKSYGLRYWSRSHYKLEQHLRHSFKQCMAQRALLGAIDLSQRRKFDFTRVQTVLSGPDPDYNADSVYPMQAQQGV